MVDLCGDGECALKHLLKDPTASDLIQLLRRKRYTGILKMTIDTEDGLLEGAIVYYEHPSFDNTDGVTRQFTPNCCANVLDTIRCSFRRAAWSPLSCIQTTGAPHNEAFWVYDRTFLIHEGPGIPFLALYVFWYIATGEEHSTLPYVSLHDLSPQTASVVSQVRRVLRLHLLSLSNS